MSERFPPEKVKAMEAEFKEYLKNKDTILHECHETLNKIFATLPKTGILSYATSENLVRGELTCADGSTYLTWWASEDVLGYCIIGAMSGMFLGGERSNRWFNAAMLGVDLREKFIDVVNFSIDIMEEVSQEWDICIS